MNLSVVLTHGLESLTTLQHSIAATRRLLPHNPLIVSGWEGADYTALTNTKLTLSPRPLALPNATDAQLQRLNEHLAGALAGINHVKTSHTLLMRAGVKLQSLDWLTSLGMPAARKPRTFTQEKVLIPAAFFRLTSGSNCLAPFFFAHWIQAGRTNDLLTLWNVPPADLRSLGDYREGQELPVALRDEQYLIKETLKREKIMTSPPYEHHLEVTAHHMRLSESVLGGCFSVLYPWEWRCSVLGSTTWAADAQIRRRESRTFFNKVGLYTRSDLDLLAHRAREEERNA